MVDGKALIDLRQLNKCDLDGECVEVCPTDVVTLIIQPAEEKPLWAALKDNPPAAQPVAAQPVAAQPVAAQPVAAPAD